MTIKPVWHGSKIKQDDVEALLNAGKPVALLTRIDDFLHYTVVSGLDEKSFLLFDSLGKRKLARKVKSGHDVLIRSNTVVTLDLE